MRETQLDSGWDVPIVSVILNGKQKKNTRARLVFDTGSAFTQLDVDLVEFLGYSARDAIGLSSVKGATGEAVDGYIISMSSLFLFGKEFNNIQVLTYDFKNFSGIDGLLGWDLIKKLHLEMNGPQGMLKIY